MAETRPNSLIRLFPSLTDVAFLMPLVFLFARLDGTRHLLSDGDTGWHIRAGEWMLAHHQVLRHDIFSFTKPGQPWFAWEWLWDVIFAWLHQRWGLEAVVLSSVLLISLTSALLFRLVRRRCPNNLLAIALTLTATAGSSLHWLARPHLFTMLFVVIFFSMLERVREGRTRLLFWLPALTVLWTNLHGGFVAGLLIIAAYAGGEAAAALLATDTRQRAESLAAARRYGAALAACLGATLINPYTYHLHAAIYAFLSDSYAYDHISEYQSVSFHHPLALYYEPLFVLGIVCAFWNLSKRRFVYTFLLLGWAHLSLMAVRNVPLYLSIAAPIAGFTLYEMFRAVSEDTVPKWTARIVRSLEGISTDIGLVERIGRVHLVSAAALAIVGALIYAPAPSLKFKAEYDPQHYPAKALEALRSQDPAKRIFADDEWGDYLIYSLYPSGGKVFVDGRADFYGSKFNNAYVDVLRVKYDWEDNLKKFGIDTVILSPDNPLASTLKQSPRWRLTYDDGVANVFRALVRQSPASVSKISVAENSSGIARDREITQSHDRDPRITKTNLRSEPI
jgi:hypothetical protein